MLAPIRRTLEIGAWLARDPLDPAASGRPPHLAVHRQGKSCVRYFPPMDGGSARHPLFISAPLTRGWRSVDLHPGRSVIAHLTAAGVPIYLLDWGRPGPEDRAVRFGDLVDDLLPRALRRAARHARTEGTLAAGVAMDTLGHGLGGTVLAITLARDGSLARRMALLAAPIDFHACPRLTTWTRPETFPVDAIVDGLGNVPGAMLRRSARLLDVRAPARRGLALLGHLDDGDPRARWAEMPGWEAHAADVPGEVYRELIQRCCVDNAPMNGGWEMNGAPVDLGGATLPAVAFGATGAALCPPAASFGLTQVWGGPVQTVELPGGPMGMGLGDAFPRALLSWLDRPLPAEA